jgi:hypothetical protein
VLILSKVSPQLACRLGGERTQTSLPARKVGLEHAAVALGFAFLLALGGRLVPLDEAFIQNWVCGTITLAPACM